MACSIGCFPTRAGPTRLADTAGGPNGAAPAAGGGVVVAQNGGFDFGAAGLGDAPPPRRVEPSHPGRLTDGEVQVLASGGLSAPNDLVVTADGTILFTDSPVFADVSRYPYDLAKREGRVWAVDRDGGLRLFADQFAFCNGIALDLDGSVLVVEANGIVRLAADGTEREWAHPGDERRAMTTIVADGIVPRRRRAYLRRGVQRRGIRVFEDGRPVDFLPVPGGAVVTNCCFGGADGRTLFATSAFPARSWPGKACRRPALAAYDVAGTAANGR